LWALSCCDPAAFWGRSDGYHDPYRHQQGLPLQKPKLAR